MLSDKVLILGQENPYKGREDDLQIAIADHLSYNYKTQVWYHVPNGGYRTGKEAAKFKRMGVTAGVSDVILDEPRQGFHGLRIELKVNKGRLSEYQTDFLNKASERGYLCAVCYSYDTATQLIKDYLNGLYKAKPEEEANAA